ncbi:MAG: HAD family hydrolase [Candidatus Babeliales bacterium]
MKNADVTFIISKTDCTLCYGEIERAVARLPYINIIQVNYLAKEIYIHYQSKYLTAELIQKKIESLGYGAVNKKIVETEAQALLAFKKKLYYYLFCLSIFLTLLLTIGSLPLLTSSRFLCNRYLHWFLASIIQLSLGSWVIYKNSYVLFLKENISSQLIGPLLTLGLYCYAFYLTFFDTYYPLGCLPAYYALSSYMLLFLFATFLLNEAVAATRKEQIEQMNKDFPDYVTVLRPKTMYADIRQWIRIPSNHVRKYDVMLIHPHDYIIADGIVLDGGTYVTETAISGNPFPVFKKYKDLIISGSKNLTKTLTIRVLHAGNTTTYNHTVYQATALFKKKITEWLPLFMLETYYLPLCMLMSTLFLLTYTLLFPLYPPTLLTTLSSLCLIFSIVFIPFTRFFVTAIQTCYFYEALKHDILFAHPYALETLHTVNHIIFNKTGTITLGIPHVVSHLFFIPTRKSSLLFPHELPNYEAKQRFIAELIKATKNVSTNPFIHAIATFLDSLFDNLTERHALPKEEEYPSGLEAIVNNQTVIIGPRSLMKRYRISMPPIIAARSKELSPSIPHFFVTINRKCIALFIFDDRVHPHMITLVDNLHAMNYKTSMLVEQTPPFQKNTPIQHTVSALLPEDKHRAVLNLKTTSNDICMIGSGINDAPSLAEATIGITFATAPRVALLFADIIVQSTHTLTHLPSLIRYTKQNNQLLSYFLYIAYFFALIACPLWYISMHRYIITTITQSLLISLIYSLCTLSVTLILWHSSHLIWKNKE